MKYFLNFEFKNKTLSVLEAYVELIQKTRKRHLKNNCTTTIFSKDKYKIVMNGAFIFYCVEENRSSINIETLLKTFSVSDIQDIIDNKNEKYKCKSTLSIYVYNGNDKKQIKELSIHPLDTIANSLGYLRDAFLIDNKMEIF